MKRANVPENIRYLLSNEAFMTATLLNGLVIVEINGRKATRYEHWDDQIPKFAANLRTWGEAGVVKLRDIKTPKYSDKGRTCMFVGYALNHDGDCYRMYDPLTKRVHVTRDIKWLHRMYFNSDEKPT